MSNLTKANNTRRSNRNGRLIYPSGTELRTVQVVLSLLDWRAACLAGGTRGKAAGGIRNLITRYRTEIDHAPYCQFCGAKRKEYCKCA